jgi:predicted DCC family thiol-disulfide oxidoreductase YuxK
VNTLTIFYDAHCGLCSRFRRWMLDQPAYVRLDFMPYDSEQARKRCPELSKLRADQEIVVMGDDGSLWQGAAAWVTCLWALREYREWSLRLATPGMLGLARKVVHWISSNRISLSHLLRLRGDDALRSRVAEVHCPDGSCALPERTAA